MYSVGSSLLYMYLYVHVHVTDMYMYTSVTCFLKWGLFGLWLSIEELCVVNCSSARPPGPMQLNEVLCACMAPAESTCFVDHSL